MFGGSFELDTEYCFSAYQVDYYVEDTMKLYLFTFDLIDGSVKSFVI